MYRKSFVSLGLLLVVAQCFAVNPPKLIYPVKGQMVSKLNPTFTWKSTAKPNMSFEIKIAEDPAFTVNVIQFKTRQLSFTCDYPYLEAGKNYYWTIRAEIPNDRGILEKTLWSHQKRKEAISYKFTVAQNAIGFVGYRPRIASPAHNAEINTLQPGMTWVFPLHENKGYQLWSEQGAWISPALTNVQYRLMISTSTDFQADTKTFVIQDADQSFMLTIPYLQPSETYWWKVRAEYVDPRTGITKESNWTKARDNSEADVVFHTSATATGSFGFEEGLKEEIFDQYKLRSVERITSGNDNSFAPTVSMNGQKLAFCNDNLGQIEIFVKSLNARTGGGETRKTVSQKNKLNYNPFYLFNNEEVGFYSNRYNDEIWHLFTSNRGTGVTIQTIGMDMADDHDNFNLYGSCSTDGKIVFTVRYPNSDIYFLYLLDMDDDSKTQLRPGVFPDIRNDDRIVYSSNETGNYELWIVELEGRSVFRPTVLTSNPADDYDPAFSPDGSMIAFTSNRSGNSDIWVMNADGTNQEQRTFHPMVDRRPQWMDNQTIIFQSNRDRNDDDEPVYNIFKIKINR